MSASPEATPCVMDMHHAIPVALLLTYAGVVHADVAPSALPPMATTASFWPRCRTPSIRQSQWKRDAEEGGSKLHVARDVDGDGVPDPLDAWDSSGSGGGATEIKLTLSRSGRVLKVEDCYSFESLSGVIVAPDAAVANQPIRRFLEDALASVICDGLDPSFAWLRDSSHALHWISGPPRLSSNYMLFSTLPADRVLAKNIECGSEDATGVWLTYIGLNHGRGKDLSVGHKPDVLARRDGRVLLGTAHGVLLTNEKRSRHAWIYVNENPGHKLRFPSIKGARFDGDFAIITTSSKIVRVNLTTGALVEEQAK